MLNPSHDARIRSAAFAWLAEQAARHGDVLPRSLLAEGFYLDGERVPLLGPQGIFKPHVMAGVPLSITTAPHGPYDDSFAADGLLRYRYRGTDRNHADNRGLRFAMERRLPLVYIHGIAAGKYLVTWPVFVVADDPGNLVFTVAVDDAQHLGLPARIEPQAALDESADAARWSYATAVMRVRLHQRTFRERVLDAYQRQCAIRALPPGSTGWSGVVPAGFRSRPAPISKRRSPHRAGVCSVGSVNRLASVAALWHPIH